MFRVNNRNTRTMCEICSKLIIKAPERRYWRRSGVFIVNFEHFSHLVLLILFLTLSRWISAESVLNTSFDLNKSMRKDIYLNVKLVLLQLKIRKIIFSNFSNTDRNENNRGDID